MITKQFLEELGLNSVSETEKAKMIVHIQEVLEERIGARIEGAVNSNSKMDEFENLAANGDNQAKNDWLNQNIPDYQQIITEEKEKIKAEIRPQVASIVASGA